MEGLIAEEDVESRMDSVRRTEVVIGLEKRCRIIEQEKYGTTVFD